MKYLKVATSILISVLIFCIVLWKIGREPTFQFFGDLLYRGQTKEKIIALTFDDGPSPNNTEDILAILKDLNITATFFMIGQNIEKYPELAKKVLASGHQIANHSYSHQKTLLSSRNFFKTEITKTDALIKSVGYEGDIVFRPPFGKKLFNLPLALRDLGKLSVTWDAESEDTETQDPQVLSQNVLSHIHPGSIILFHDGFAPKPGTKAAVRKVIQELIAKGYQFTTINELRNRSRQ